jgi:hypothetical protein
MCERVELSDIAELERRVFDVGLSHGCRRRALNALLHDPCDFEPGDMPTRYVWPRKRHWIRALTIARELLPVAKSPSDELRAWDYALESAGCCEYDTD